MRVLVAILSLLCVSIGAFAQGESDTVRYRIDDRRAFDTLKYSTPDIRTWRPEDPTIDHHSTHPMISMTSLVTGMHRERPERVFVILPNNTLEAWGRVNVSNGQAQNWGPFPNSYLDARTLSFPPPR